MTSRVDDMVDTIHADVSILPRTLKKVAGYVTGTPDIQWTQADWDRFADAAKVRISQRPGEAILGCDVFDIEDHAWTISDAVNAAKLRKEHHRRSEFYFPEGLLDEIEATLRQAELLDWVDYWVANPSLSREQAISRLGRLNGRIKAWQWAFPSTNPHTLIPGTRLTLAEANVDLSVTLPDWHPIPHSTHRIRIHQPAIVKRIHPKVKVAIPSGGAATGLAALVSHHGVHLTATEWTAIGAFCTLLAAWAKSSGTHS